MLLHVTVKACFKNIHLLRHNVVESYSLKDICFESVVPANFIPHCYPPTVQPTSFSTFRKLLLPFLFPEFSFQFVGMAPSRDSTWTPVWIDGRISKWTAERALTRRWRGAICTVFASTFHNKCRCQSALNDLS